MLLNTKFALKSGKGTYNFRAPHRLSIAKFSCELSSSSFFHYASYVTVTANLQLFCKFHTVCILFCMNNDLRKKGRVNPLF